MCTVYTNVQSGARYFNTPLQALSVTSGLLAGTCLVFSDCGIGAIAQLWGHVSVFRDNNIPRGFGFGRLVPVHPTNLRLQLQSSNSLWDAADPENTDTHISRGKKA